MAAAVDDYVRFGGRVVDCGAELSSVAQICRVWRRVVECGAKLSSAAQSCWCLPGRCQPGRGRAGRCCQPGRSPPRRVLGCRRRLSAAVGGRRLREVDAVVTATPTVCV